MEGVLSSTFLKGENGQAISKSLPKEREGKKGIHLFSKVFKRVQDSQEEYRSSHWTVQTLVLADNCSGQNPMPLIEQYNNKDCLITAMECFTDSRANGAISGQWLIKETGPTILQMTESENSVAEGLGLCFQTTEVQDSNTVQPQISVSGQLTSASGQGGIPLEGDENIHITINQSYVSDHHDFIYTDSTGVQAETIDENCAANNAMSTPKASAGAEDLEAVIVQSEALEMPKITDGLGGVKAEFVEMVNEEVQIRDKTTLDSVKSTEKPITKAEDEYKNTDAHKNPQGDNDIKFGPSTINLENFDAKTSEKMKMPDGQGYTEGNYGKSVLDQISSAVMNQKGSNKSWELLLKLEPESLGKVVVKVTLKGDSMVAKFLASNQETRQIIEMNCQQLEQALNNQGLNISKVEVSEMDYESNNLLDNPYDRGGQSSNNRGYSPSDDGGYASKYKEKRIEEAMKPYDYMEESSVNYFA